MWVLRDGGRTRRTVVLVTVMSLMAVLLIAILVVPIVIAILCRALPRGQVVHQALLDLMRRRNASRARPT